MSARYRFDFPELEKLEAEILAENHVAKKGGSGRTVDPEKIELQKKHEREHKRQKRAEMRARN